MTPAPVRSRSSFTLSADDAIDSPGQAAQRGPGAGRRPRPPGTHAAGPFSAACELCSILVVPGRQAPGRADSAISVSVTAGGTPAGAPPPGPPPPPSRVPPPCRESGAARRGEGATG